MPGIAIQWRDVCRTRIVRRNIQLHNCIIVIVRDRRTLRIPTVVTTRIYFGCSGNVMRNTRQHGVDVDSARVLVGSADLETVLSDEIIIVCYEQKRNRAALRDRAPAPKPCLPISPTDCCGRWAPSVQPELASCALSLRSMNGVSVAGTMPSRELAAGATGTAPS
jgi:hypothetical protein